MTQLTRLVCILVTIVALAGLADAAPKRAPKKLKLPFPRFTVPAGANVGACVFIRLPIDETFDLSGVAIRHRGIAHGPGATVVHFLVHLYQGDNLEAFGARERQVILDRGCLELGPDDRHVRQLIASGAAAQMRTRFPPGMVMPLTPSPGTPDGPPAGIGILLDANWINTGSKDRRVSSRVVFERADPETARRQLSSFIARDAEPGIDVAPFTIGTTESIDARWQPSRDVCLYDVTTHMHRRGVFVSIDVLDTQGALRNPEPGSPIRSTRNARISSALPIGPILDRVAP